MGPVEKAVRKAVQAGDKLETPSQSKPFRVGKLSSEGIVLKLGQEETPTVIPWRCLEGIPTFLDRYGKVRINGSGKSQLVVSGTLDGFLKQHVNRLTAGWVAVLLEKAGVVEIERTRPAYVKARGFAEARSDC